MTEKEGAMKVVEGKTCREVLYPKGCVVSKCMSDCSSKHEGKHGVGKCDFTGACFCSYLCT